MKARRCDIALSGAGRWVRSSLSRELLLGRDRWASNRDTSLDVPDDEGIRWIGRLGRGHLDLSFWSRQYKLLSQGKGQVK